MSGNSCRVAAFFIGGRMQKIVLASNSPRRKELLQMADIEFKVIAADIDESGFHADDPAELVRTLALQKAKAVAVQVADAAVIGADTVVELDGEIMGKPENEAAAAVMLRKLSGRRHYVHTGVAIVKGQEIQTFVSTAAVDFYEISDNEINGYIATGEPLDKAGAYGIQGRGALLVKGIEGDFYTVVGLPIAELVRRLRIL